MTIWHTFCKYP